MCLLLLLCWYDAFDGSFECSYEIKLCIVVKNILLNYLILDFASMTIVPTEKSNLSLLFIPLFSLGNSPAI